MDILFVLVFIISLANVMHNLPAKKLTIKNAKASSGQVNAIVSENIVDSLNIEEKHSIDFSNIENCEYYCETYIGDEQDADTDEELLHI